MRMGRYKLVFALLLGNEPLHLCRAFIINEVEDHRPQGAGGKCVRMLAPCRACSGTSVASYKNGTLIQEFFFCLLIVQGTEVALGWMYVIHPLFKHMCDMNL